MGIECDFSYSDLFYAAHGRRPNASEKFRLANMTQKERNEYVAELANLAKWQTQEKLGTDNQIYTAFAPKF
jgi:hypothetical protein